MNILQDVTEYLEVELHWTSATFVEVLVLRASGVIIFPSAAKHLILVESVMGMILVAMLAKTLVPTALGDFWMPVEFAAGITNHAQGVMAF